MGGSHTFMDMHSISANQARNPCTQNEKKVNFQNANDTFYLKHLSNTCWGGRRSVMKRRVPRMEPWGTPLESGEGPDAKDFSLKNWVWSWKEEWNQQRRVKVMPNEESRLRRRDGVKGHGSRRMRMDIKVASAPRRRPLMILIRAVWVWWVLKVLKTN